MFNFFKMIIFSLSKDKRKNLLASKNSSTPVWCLKFMIENRNIISHAIIIGSERLPEKFLNRIVFSRKHHYSQAMIVPQLKDPEVLNRLMLDEKIATGRKMSIALNQNLTKETIHTTFDKIIEQFSEAENSDEERINFSLRGQMFLTLLRNPALTREERNGYFTTYIKFRVAYFSRISIEDLLDEDVVSVRSVLLFVRKQHLWNELVDYKFYDKAEWFVRACKKFLEEEGIDISEQMPLEYLIEVVKLSIDAEYVDKVGVKTLL